MGLHSPPLPSSLCSPPPDISLLCRIHQTLFAQLGTTLAVSKEGPGLESLATLASTVGASPHRPGRWAM